MKLEDILHLMPLVYHVYNPLNRNVSVLPKVFGIIFENSDGFHGMSIDVTGKVYSHLTYTTRMKEEWMKEENLNIRELLLYDIRFTSNQIYYEDIFTGGVRLVWIPQNYFKQYPVINATIKARTRT